MKIGIGLPAAAPDANLLHVADYAATAEAAGFHSLGVVDRLAYPTLDPIVALAGAAAATTRIQLTTAVLLAPLRQPAVLAKQVATLVQISGDRFVLGMGVGNRTDDYEAAGVEFERRGAILDELLATLRSGTAMSHVGGPSGGLPAGRLRLGGLADRALQRVARLGCDWIYGGPDPAGFAAAAAQLDECWMGVGRTGRPRRAALAFGSLGDDPRGDAERYIGTYYAYAPFVQKLLDAVPLSAAALAEMVGEYEQRECDELIIFPCTTALTELERIAEVVGPLLDQS